MTEIILIKNGEIALKGLNRGGFEDTMIRNIKWRLRDLGKFKITKAQSTVYIEPKDEEADLDEVLDRLKKVFGIIALSRACVCEKDFEKIKTAALEYTFDELEKAKTFKVEAKRSDKHFNLTSPEICMELGGYLLEKHPGLKVDVHEPELVVTVEIRDFAAYVHAGKIEGAGGIPVGTGGRGMLLISGGIDSPVAGYMMAKRGIELNAVHFVSPPYTSERAKLKVVDLCKEVAEYSGKINLSVVGFTEIQEEIKNKCPEEFFTVIMRRFMMRIAQRLAGETKCDALITGESAGQVASQTLKAIACTDAVCTMPVFRPLIGMDKNEIITIARKIGTFETSILPFEDCCTVFTPKHPKTRPQLEAIEQAEEVLEMEDLIQRACQEIELIKIH